MADLSVDDQQAPNIDDLVNAVGDLSAPDTYVPPRSGTYRTSRYPGFFGSATGATPSNTPNAVAGDDPVALPPDGVDPNAASASTSGTGLSSITSNPVNNDPSEGADQRQANALDNARSTGYDTDPDDALKAATIAGSFTGPTGLLGLGLQTGLNMAGVPTPSLSLEHGVTLDSSSPFDFKSNDNSRLGYDDAFTQAQRETLAKNPRYTTPQSLANQTQQRTREILDQRDTNSRNKTAADAMNSTTGFRGSTPPGSGSSFGDTADGQAGASKQGALASLGDGIASTVGKAQKAGITGDVTVDPNGKMSFGPDQPTTPSDKSANPGPGAAPTLGPTAPTANGGGSGNGGANGGGGGGSFGHDDAGNANAGRRGFNKGGVVPKNAMKPHHKEAARTNHNVLKQLSARTGKTVPAIIAMHKGDQNELGNRARLAAHVMMLACGGKVRKYAAGGPVIDGADPSADPASDPQYSPPPSATVGNTDTVPAKLTPGEMVIAKQASTQYDPAVLKALNDPAMADQINQLVEQFLSDQGDGQGGQDDEDAADGGADDGSEDDSPDAGSDDASGLGSLAPMRGIPSPKSKLASVTRAA